MTTEWTLTALADVAHHLTGIPGRKSLLWISESFPITIELDIQSFTQGGARRANQQLDLFSAREWDIGRLLTDAQVAVYPINPPVLARTQSTAPASPRAKRAQPSSPGPIRDT